MRSTGIEDQLTYSLIDEFTDVWEPPDINIIVGDRIKLDGQKEPKDES